MKTGLQEGKIAERLVSHSARVNMALWRSAHGQGSERLFSCGAVVEAVTVLFKHGYHRTGVAIARSRLDLDYKLVREVIASWAGQS